MHHSRSFRPFPADHDKTPRYSSFSPFSSAKDIERVIVVDSPLAFSLLTRTVESFSLLSELKASKMASPRGAWSAKFPVYQLDFTAIASGKRVASTKRRIRWYETVTRSCFYLSAINYKRL